MSDIPLPLPQDLMVPTLRAAIELGGPAEYRSIDVRTLELAGITERQQAIDYDETATATGAKILHRIAWARTMLKRIGALEGTGYGRWAPTKLGIELGDMEDTQASARIDQLLSEAYETVEPSADQLAEFKRGGLQLGTVDSGSGCGFTCRAMVWGRGSLLGVV